MMVHRKHSTTSRVRRCNIEQNNKYKSFECGLKLIEVLYQIASWICWKYSSLSQYWTLSYLNIISCGLIHQAAAHCRHMTACSATITRYIWQYDIHGFKFLSMLHLSRSIHIQHQDIHQRHQVNCWSAHEEMSGNLVISELVWNYILRSLTKGTSTAY